MRSESATIECVGLQVSYAGVPAINAVDLGVDAGEVVAVLGPSGSGKSTLLHAIAGLVRPSAGEIRLSGRSIATRRRCEPPERRNVGLVFQDFALWPHLTALDTVAYPQQRAGRSRAQARRVAQALLDQLGIGELARRHPAQLSGGQQQRVGLARALARDPAVFLLDEPTAHLDTHLRVAFQEAVRDRQTATGAAAMYATHDAGEALALADRIALVVAGRLVQLDAPRIAYDQPISVAAARLTGACSVLLVEVSAASTGAVRVALGTDSVTVPGGGTVDAEPRIGQLLLRPDWVTMGGPFRGRVSACAYRGAVTDYQLSTPVGTVGMQLAGPPRASAGDAIDWGIRQAWVLPNSGAPDPITQSRAVITPG